MEKNAEDWKQSFLFVIFLYRRKLNQIERVKGNEGENFIRSDRRGFSSILRDVKVKAGRSVIGMEPVLMEDLERYCFLSKLTGNHNANHPVLSLIHIYGVNLKGYYVWSTMDLYSWINGYKKRYGLVLSLIRISRMSRRQRGKRCLSIRESRAS